MPPTGDQEQKEVGLPSEIGEVQDKYDAFCATLFLILAVSMLDDDKTIDEGSIWKIVEGMGFHTFLNLEKEKLPEFLHKAFVTTSFLSLQDIVNGEGESVKHYSWGSRADTEVNKKALLVFLIRHMPDTLLYNELFAEE